MSPRLKAPPGTCDTHIHIYDSKHKVAPTATFKPPEASVADYLKACERLGIARTVVVQPSAYATDNTCLLESMAAMGERARGVGVFDPNISDTELERFDERGVRGMRYFMLGGGVLTRDSLERMSARAAELGWHINLQIDGRDFADWEPMLNRLPSALVIDHVGKFLEPVTTEHPGFRALLRLVGRGAYLKLAAPYETSKLGPPHYDDVGALAKALVRAAPERMLWASNWPFPNAGAATPQEDWMLDMLLDWIPDERSRRLALVDNAARLYGFLAA